jgi:phosphoribosylformylglycinamidine cyclo-ligase
LFKRPGPDEPLTYAAAGVDEDAAAVGLRGLLDWVRLTESFRSGAGQPLVPNGSFASVLRLTDDVAVAISTDGVGSKSAVAQLTGTYENVGWDAVAVNVNDVVCTGAEPLALVDYISLQIPHPELLEALGKGLHDGAARARIAVVGGELSQHPDTLTGPREGYAFDISGTCIGMLQGRAPITGKGLAPGDVILGMPSDGIHANGITLARRVLLDEVPGAIDRVLEESGRTVGEELLRPTHIYVPEVMAMLDAGVAVKGLAHISGGGLLNLLRLDANVGYRFDAMPPVPAIFGTIEREGNVDRREMYRVFNMGIGFCAIVDPASVDAAIAAAASVEGHAFVAGTVVSGPERRIELPAEGLVGRNGRFETQQ